jgi:hypothetical protein
MDGKPSRHIALGQQSAPHFFKSQDKIMIEIDAELVWPLLVDKYTKSEKLMANIILATTITHEMMVRHSYHYLFFLRKAESVTDIANQHAFSSAPFKWLSNPASFGVTDPEQVAACKVLNNELIDPNHGDRWDEPYFEDDIYNEVGHAFEEHVSIEINMNLPCDMGQLTRGTPGSIMWLLAFHLWHYEFK